jgi:hypothetical protein
MKSPPQDEKAQGKAINATVGMEAIEERQALYSNNRIKYLEICNNSHQSITEALAALKAKAKSKNYQDRHQGRD